MRVNKNSLDGFRDFFGVFSEGIWLCGPKFTAPNHYVAPMTTKINVG